MRSMAIMTISTGTTVHSVPLTRLSHRTGGGIRPTSPSWRNRMNCSRHSTQATALAQPASRMAPMRCTTSPL